MRKVSGLADSSKPIDNVAVCEPSRNEVEVAEQERRFNRALEILLKADLLVLADLSKQAHA